MMYIMAIHFPEMPATRSEMPVLKPISCLSEAECPTNYSDAEDCTEDIEEEVDLNTQCHGGCYL